MTNEEFKAAIRAGIPDVLPEPREYDKDVNHAPKRKDILTEEEKKLALRNALRYFPKKFHKTLAPEFAASCATTAVYICTDSDLLTTCTRGALTNIRTSRSRLPQ